MHTITNTLICASVVYFYYFYHYRYYYYYTILFVFYSCDSFVIRLTLSEGILCTPTEVNELAAVASFQCYNTIIIYTRVVCVIRKKIWCSPRSTHANDRQWVLIYEDVFFFFWFFPPSNKNEIILLLLSLLFLQCVRELVSREKKYYTCKPWCTSLNAIDVLYDLIM